MMEGPFAEFTGYVAGERAPRPTMRVTAITHRNDPMLRGTIEGSLPEKLFRERVQQLDHALRHRLERARPRGRSGRHGCLGPAGAGRR